jgi:hypothetical protein
MSESELAEHGLLYLLRKVLYANAESTEVKKSLDFKSFPQTASRALADDENQRLISSEIGELHAQIGESTATAHARTRVACDDLKRKVSKGVQDD